MANIGPQGRALIALHNHFGEDANPAYFRTIYEHPSARRDLIAKIPCEFALHKALVELDDEPTGPARRAGRVR